MSLHQRKTQISCSKIESKPKIQPKPSILSNFFSSNQKIWLFCIIFRSINSLLIQTYFNPDEHWQSLEVAHRIAFGYGHLTWEWKKGIRSYLHPMIFVFLYKVLGVLKLDSPWVMRGSEDVMYYLAKEARNDKVESILFLMPCHATPYYSTLHSDLPMRFLDCSPSEVKGILNESDRFLMNPLNFASDMFKESPLPSHIVLFDAEERHLHELLESHSFKEVKRFFHAHFKVDRDLQGSIAVYALRV